MRPAHANAGAQVRRRRLGTMWRGLLALLVSLHAGVAQGEEASAQPTAVPGWVRVDMDNYGMQVWFGATHRWRGLDIVSDVYLVDTNAEIDIGAAWTVGESLTLLGVVGPTFDFSTTDYIGTVFEMDAYLTAGPWYLESWDGAYLAVEAKDTYGPSYLYTRTFLLRSLNDVLAVGPHAELALSLEDADGHSRLTSLALGGAGQVAYGDSNTLLVFLGYETREATKGGGAGIAGRVTFLREW
ncbi:MAG: hypothetical protein AB1505_26245 [Candidatus Latescibacterota bacterium]